MISDMIGAAYMLLMMTVFEVGNMGDEPYLTVPALIISTVLIFVLNYFVTFRKIDNKLRVQLPLIFAIVTAPYTFWFRQVGYIKQTHNAPTEKSCRGFIVLVRNHPSRVRFFQFYKYFLKIPHLH